MKIKVVSLNVWHGGRLWDEMISFLEQENPDILLVQESYNSDDLNLEPRFRTIHELNKRFSFVDHDFAPAFGHDISEGVILQGNAIFTKFPITNRQAPRFFVEPFNPVVEEKRENFPRMPRNLQHVGVEINDVLLNFMNFQGVWDLDGTNDSPQRLKMSQVITDAVKGLENVILAGDTNAQRHCKTILDIEKYLTNVFGDELPTSFNVLQKDLEKYPGYATTTVDMMFTSSSLKVTEHYCPRVNVSDHLPLVAIIEVPESCVTKL